MLRKIIEKGKDGFEWIDIENPSTEELTDIARNYQLHEPSLLECLLPDHLPKYEFIEDSYFIMLRMYDPGAKAEGDTIQELSRKIAIFYKKNNIITIHSAGQEILNSFIGNPANLKKCSTPVATIFHMVNLSLMSFELPTQRLQEELDQYESAIFIKDGIPNILKSLYHLKRKAVVNNRILNFSIDIIEHLDDLEVQETLIQDLRELRIRLYTAFEEVQEGANHLLDIYMSLSARKTNDVVRILTVFSVFFMPLTFIVGIYGMNFKFMPELNSRLGYPGVLLLMALVTLGIYLWFKRKGWL